MTNFVKLKCFETVLLSSIAKVGTKIMDSCLKDELMLVYTLVEIIFHKKDHEQSSILILQHAVCMFSIRLL